MPYAWFPLLQLVPRADDVKKFIVWLSCIPKFIVWLIPIHWWYLLRLHSTTKLSSQVPQVCSLPRCKMATVIIMNYCTPRSDGALPKRARELSAPSRSRRARLPAPPTSHPAHPVSTPSPFAHSATCAGYRPTRNTPRPGNPAAPPAKRNTRPGHARHVQHVEIQRHAKPLDRTHDLVSARQHSRRAPEPGLLDVELDEVRLGTRVPRRARPHKHLDHPFHQPRIGNHEAATSVSHTNGHVALRRTTTRTARRP